MRRPRLILLLCVGPAALIALGISGCARGPETGYGKSRGTSLNGTAVVAAMLEDSGHDIRVAIRLNDELADWAGGIVRFAPYPGPPSEGEGAWFAAWLGQDGDRWLIYVVNDFDTAHEYWTAVAEGAVAQADPARKAEAEEHRADAADWLDRLPKKAAPSAPAGPWFGVDTAWLPPRVCKKLSGPWATDIDAAKAAITVHEPLKADRGRTLLEEDGKPLVVEKRIGKGRVLVIANGSFLLNEAVAHPARRALAERVIEWAGRDESPVALVEGSGVLADGDGMPTLWSLLSRLPSFRWVAIQSGLAALLAALARAPRLGRPRPVPPSGADRPAEHALALGALLARTGAAQDARDLVAEYRRWRYPRSPRAKEPRFEREPTGSSHLQGGAPASPGTP
jgi:hypothetical protein